MGSYLSDHPKGTGIGQSAEGWTNISFVPKIPLFNFVAYYLEIS